MAWRIEVANGVEKQLAKLGHNERRRIIRFLADRIAGSNDPRSTGAALAGDLSGLWRYRVGDYRVICDIRNNELVVLVVEVGHRREVYR